MEERTWTGDNRVGEFTPVDPKGKTDRQLLVATLKQAEMVHACVEQVHHRIDQLSSAVGGLNTRTGVVEGSVKKLAQMFGAMPVADDDDPPPPPPVTAFKMSWREHGKIILTVLGSVGGAVVLIRVFAPGFVAFFNAVWHAIQTVQL